MSTAVSSTIAMRTTVSQALDSVSAKQGGGPREVNNTQPRSEESKDLIGASHNLEHAKLILSANTADHTTKPSKSRKRHRRKLIREEEDLVESSTLFVSLDVNHDVNVHAGGVQTKDDKTKKKIKSILKQNRENFASDIENYSFGSHRKGYKMEEKDFEDFPSEVRQKHEVLYDKLKALKIAIGEYVLSTKYKRADLKETGDFQEAKTYRPVTPANVKVLFRLVAKDVKGLRQRFDKWKFLNTADGKLSKQLELKVEEVEKILAKLNDELKRLRDIEKDDVEKRPKTARKSAKKKADIPIKIDEHVLPPLPKVESEIVHERPPPKDCKDCEDCQRKEKAKDNILNNKSRPGILKSNTMSFFKQKTIMKNKVSSKPTMGESQKKVIQPVRRTLSDGSLTNFISRDLHKESTFSDTLSSSRLKREKTVLGPSRRGVFQRQVNNSYPFGSSFPELPPIWSLKRGATYVAANKTKEYWSST